MRTRALVLSVVASGLVVPAMPAVAQDTAGATIGEIIVTARKREESILKVPVIETVVTQQQLEQYQITDLNDLSAKVPGLSMGAAVLSIGPQISVRGVGTSTLDAGVEQSVSLNLDGLSMTQGLAYKSGLFDLAQAEVLKGPQALFFGKNSPGGVVSLRTADPGNRTEIIGRLGYEYEAEQQRAELIVSTPVTETFGLRFAGLFSDQDGFFDNKATAQPGTGALDPRPNTVSATRSEIVRATALWRPSVADTLINGTQSGYAASALGADNNFHRKDFTQELRFDTELDGPVNGTVGAYYQDGEIYNRIRLHGNTRLSLPAILRVGSHQIDIESYSVFGQLRWKPIAALEIAGGVRWTDETRTDTAYNLATGTPVFTPIAVPEISSDNYSPEFTITYTPTDDLTVFGSLKRGYKSGSFTITTPVAVGINNSFGDEKVDGGEIGLKSRFLDRAFAFNVAAYYYAYDGLQVGTNEPAQGGLPIIRTINAGETEIYGVDLEASYVPPAIDGLTLNTALNWNHARFTKLEDVPCWGGQTIALGCNSVPNLSGAAGSTDPVTGLPLFTAQGSLNGNRLVRAPDWQVNAGASYDMPIGADMRLNFGVDAQYTSEYPTGLNDRADAVQDGYTILNANITASGKSDSWEVALIGNNITNEITTGSCTTLNYTGAQILPGARSGGVTSGASGLDELTCVTRPGREVWVRLTFRPMGFFK